MTAPLTCTGRAVDRDGQPVGDPCGRQFKPPGIPVDYGDGRWPLWGTRAATVEEAVARARAAGWRVSDLRADGSRDAYCRSCARPVPRPTGRTPAMTAPAVLGPNDTVPCPSDSARRRHQAHGESCRVCWPAGLPGPNTSATHPTTANEEPT